LPTLTVEIQTRVSIQQYAINRSPDLFHNPTAFAPERWLEVGPKSPYREDVRKALQPFGVGPRVRILT
jgi:cytochrome P450